MFTKLQVYSLQLLIEILKRKRYFNHVYVINYLFHGDVRK